MLQCRAMFMAVLLRILLALFLMNLAALLLPLARVLDRSATGGSAPLQLQELGFFLPLLTFPLVLWMLRILCRHHERQHEANSRTRTDGSAG